MAATNFGRVAVMCCIIYIAELSIVFGTGILVFFLFVCFFNQGFLHKHWRFTGQQGKGGNHEGYKSKAVLFYWTFFCPSRVIPNACPYFLEKLLWRWKSKSSHSFLYNVANSLVGSVFQKVSVTSAHFVLRKKIFWHLWLNGGKNQMYLETHEHIFQASFG